MVLSLLNSHLKTKQGRKTRAFGILFHLQNMIEETSFIKQARALPQKKKKKQLLNVLADLDLVWS